MKKCYAGEILDKSKVRFVPNTHTDESCCFEDTQTRWSERASSVVVCSIDSYWCSSFGFFSDEWFWRLCGYMWWVCFVATENVRSSSFRHLQIHKSNGILPTGKVGVEDKQDLDMIRLPWVLGSLICSVQTVWAPSTLMRLSVSFILTLSILSKA